MDNQSLYIGIDIGTSGVRALAIDGSASVRGQTHVSLPAPTLHDNTVEQPAALWWTAVLACLDLLRVQIDAGAVRALCVDGTSATLLVTAADGNPLYPALLYSDARATEQAAQLARQAPADTAAQGATSTLAKLLWLQQHAMLSSDRRLFHQADWLAARLRGDALAVSDINNAAKLGYDAGLDDWPAWLSTLLEEQGIDRRLLPTVVRPGTATGTIATALAKRFGLSETTRIVAGTTDSTAAFIATGARQVGDAVTSLGSTLVVKVVSDTPVFSRDHGVYSQPLLIDDQLCWLAGGASNSGGKVLRQFFTDQQLQAMTTRLDPQRPTGLDYYPLTSPGERFPVSDPTLMPRLSPRPGNDVIFYQGILEGIAAIEAQAYRLLHSLGAPYPISIRTTGGGAQNPAWSRIRERLSGIPQREPVSTQAAYGSALLAKRVTQNS